MAINPVYWTLCLEFQFYLLYAAILMLAKDRAHAWLIGAAAISLPWAMGIVPQLPGLFPTLWYAFLAGTLAYWAWRQPRSTVIPFWAFLGVLFIAGTIRGDGFTLVAAFTAMLLYLSAQTGWIHTGLNWRWLQFLGLVSYSLYLTHNIATGVTFRIGSMLMERTVATELLWWIASIAGCVVLAGAFWWMFERPSLAWARRIGKRVRPLSAPLPV
jgi:peptidoglycan/LPS O-acetylase OafA/YrhL